MTASWPRHLRHIALALALVPLALAAAEATIGGDRTCGWTCIDPAAGI